MGARASVPEASKSDRNLRPTQRAISPDGDTERTSASGSSARCGSGLPGCATKRRIGAPSHAAPKTTVLPSGAKRAERMAPREKVSRVSPGGPAGAPARPARHPAARRAAASATPVVTAAARRQRFGRGSGAPAPLVRKRLDVPTASSAKATSRADWNLSAGAFSRQRRTSRSRPGATGGTFGGSSGGSSTRTAAIVSAGVGREKAGLPDSISKRRAPSAKMSERPSTASPRTCSGDM